MANSAFSPYILTSSAAASGGEVNIVTNPSAAVDLTGWTATGLTATRDANGGPLDPVVPTDFQLSSTASAQYFTTAGLTMPTGLQNKKLKIEFYFSQISGTGFQIQIARDSGFTNKFTLTTDSSGVTALPATAGTIGKFTTYFDSDNTSTVYFRFVSTGTGVIKFSQLVIGPGTQPQGAVVGDWQNQAQYTMITNGAIPAGNLQRNALVWRRVGTNMEARFIWGGGTATVTSSNAVTFNLPTGFTIDTTKIASTSQRDQLGTAAASLPTNFTILAPYYLTTTTIGFRKSGGTQLIESDLITNWEIEGILTIPIAEWANSGTVQLAQNDVEFLWNSTAWGTNNSTAFAYGPGGASITGALPGARIQRVRAQTPIQAGDQLFLEYSSNGVLFRTSSDFMDAAGNPIINSYSSTAGIDTSAGGYLQTVTGSNTDIDVYFFRYASIANDDSPAVDWQNGWKWRVRKVSAGASVGFGIVVPGTSSGLVSASGLTGNTTGNAIASGYVGEKIQKSITSSTAMTAVSAAFQNAVFSDATSNITVTPGIWLITAQIYFSGGTSVVSCDIGISTDSTSNSFSDGTYGINRSGLSQASGAANIFEAIPNYYQSVTSSTNYYLKLQSSFSTAPSYRGTLVAIRIA